MGFEGITDLLALGSCSLWVFGGVEKNLEIEK